jgi:hypothetical protein
MRTNEINKRCSLSGVEWDTIGNQRIHRVGIRLRSPNPFGGFWEGMDILEVVDRSSSSIADRGQL